MSLPSNAYLVSPHQIVVASDLTDAAVRLPHVIAEAKATGAAVTLVHAVRNSTMRVPSDADVEEGIYAKQVLGAMRRSLEAEGVSCSIVVRAGLAVDLVRREIARTGAGRLIIGAHSHGPCGAAMIGSVANALLTSAPVPVYVLSPAMTASLEHASPRRILHPVAPSGIYQERARFAADIAYAYGAELTLLHVMPPSNTASFYAHSLEEKIRQQLETLGRSAGVPVRTVMRYGGPTEEILSLARAEDMDLIVMGMSHEYPWWSMRNNHAHQVIAESECPVLTFRDQIVAQLYGSTFAA